MRPISMPVRLPGQDQEEYLDEFIRQVVDASEEEAVENSFDAVTVTNHSELTTLDVSAATLGELRQIVGTLITYVQSRGPKRT